MKKRFIALSLAICFSCVACGSSTTEKEASITAPTETYVQEELKEEVKEFDLEKYKKSAQDLRTSMYTAALMLNNMTNYELAHLQVAEKLNSKVDSQELLQKAFDHIEEQEWDTRENIESTDATIRKAYKEFILIESNENKEALEIETEIRNFYDAYVALYSLATSPNGSASSFESTVNKTNNFIVSSNDALDLWLETANE